MATSDPQPTSEVEVESRRARRAARRRARAAVAEAALGAAAAAGRSAAANPTTDALIEPAPEQATKAPPVGPAPGAPKLSADDWTARTSGASRPKAREGSGADRGAGEATPARRKRRGGAVARIEPDQVPAKQGGGGALAEALPADALEIARAAREARMRDIRSELRRRRRFRALGILARFMVFVLIPTAVVGWYYYTKATDMYVSKSAMIFKSGSAAAASGGLFGGFMGGGGTTTDSIALQEYITSPDILKLLIEDHGWMKHFQSETIDEWHRLPADASMSDAFSYYKGGFVVGGKVAVDYDPLEGIVRLEVTGATPEAAQQFSAAIIGYGEELVNSLNERSRNDGVRMSESKVAEAREALRDSQRQVAEVQEQLNIFSVESEAGGLQTRIITLEAEIDEILGEIAKLKTVTKDPNDSRFVPLRTNLEIKTKQLRDLRGKLTGGEDAAPDAGPSMAQLSASLELARVDQATAQMMYSSALTSQEAALASAAEQSLFLETVVRPSTPDKASRPKRAANTGLVFLVLFATYIIGLLTLSLIREQAAI